MRAAVHAVAVLALLAAVPAHGLIAAGPSAAPAALAAASPALRLRGGGAPKEAGGKVRPRRAGKRAPSMPGAGQATGVTSSDFSTTLATDAHVCSRGAADADRARVLCRPRSQSPPSSLK